MVDILNLSILTEKTHITNIYKRRYRILSRSRFRGKRKMNMTEKSENLLNLGGDPMDVKFNALIPEDLEQLIDDSIKDDFSDVRRLSEADKTNQNYKDFMFFLKSYRVTPIYERMVHSNLSPVIPESQYLIGFKPVNGLCMLATKPQHKKILCDEWLVKVASLCSLVHSLQYILVEKDEFRIWGYVPKKCSDTCPIDEKDGYIRNFLFEL